MNAKNIKITIEVKVLDAKKSLLRQIPTVHYWSAKEPQIIGWVMDTAILPRSDAYTRPLVLCDVGGNDYRWIDFKALSLRYSEGKLQIYAGDHWDEIPHLYVL